LLAAAIDSTLFALADRNRRAIVDRLKDQPRRAGELAEALGLTPAALSRHLRVLRRSGLIREDALEEDARVRICHLERAPFDELRGWLDDVESFWTVELASFRDHVVRKTARKKARR
jgi:DNA-binding transcriptional ArsR family regulator